jgi:peroxiredoxin
MLILAGLLLTACGVIDSTSPPESVSSFQEAVEVPDWFGFEMTDVRTGETFTINDFAGKVVLVETMAMWCPNCAVQANEVRKLHNLLEHPDDLVSISLDVM